VRGDARHLAQPGRQERGPWQPSPAPLDNPAVAAISSSLEKESGPAWEMSMSSLYLRGQTWWGKSYEQGKMIRWSLKTTSKAEAKRRIKLYDSRPREEPRPSQLKGPVTWDTAARDGHKKPRECSGP
jgi:hypothetical protein